jgi:hypothetical protein
MDLTFGPWVEVLASRGASQASDLHKEAARRDD